MVYHGFRPQHRKNFSLHLFSLKLQLILCIRLKFDIMNDETHGMFYLSLVPDFVLKQKVNSHTNSLFILFLFTW